MTIRLICPAPPGTMHGNRVTALRWARVLRGFGHRAVIAQQWGGERCDVLVALHARRSSDAAIAFHDAHPDRPLIIALTGTDVYHDIHHDPRARQVLDFATRVTVLQPLAILQLPEHIRERARVIYQSVAPTTGRAGLSGGHFDVCVAGHLRQVKDPFRAAAASRLLPESS